MAQKQQGYHPDGSFSAGLTQALQAVDFAIGNILTALADSGLQVAKQPETVRMRTMIFSNE